MSKAIISDAPEDVHEDYKMVVRLQANGWGMYFKSHLFLLSLSLLLPSSVYWIFSNNRLTYSFHNYSLLNKPPWLYIIYP